LPNFFIFYLRTYVRVGPWEQDKFRPERWLHVKRAPGGHIPFGYGVRVCPGKALATAELELLVTVLAGRYAWEAVESHESVGTQYLYTIPVHNLCTPIPAPNTCTHAMLVYTIAELEVMVALLPVWYICFFSCALQINK